MNECLTTPQHEKEIGYWVSEEQKGIADDIAGFFPRFIHGHCPYLAGERGVAQWSILPGGLVELYVVPASTRN